MVVAAEEILEEVVDSNPEEGKFQVDKLGAVPNIQDFVDIHLDNCNLRQEISQ